MKVLKNNKGTTMVETLVGFVILMIILGMIYGIIHFCSIMRLNAEDTEKRINIFSGEVHSNNIDENKIDIKTYKNIDENTIFTLTINTNETSTTNNYISTTLPLNDIEVKSYKYIEDTDRIVPTMIRFERRSE